MLPLYFLDEAETELEEAQAWYEARSPGLGQAFVTSIQASIERIRRSPFRHPAVDHEVRRALTRRFPYAIFYLVDEDQVVVIAVFHSSRDPKEWKARL